MKKLSILITIFCLHLSNASFAANIQNEWLLEQNEGEAGLHQVYISPDAVKIVSERQGFTIFAKAPDWDAYCYRHDNNKMWIGKLATFTGDLVMNPFAIPKYAFSRPKPAGDVQYEGVTCSNYIEDREGSVVYGSKSIKASPRQCEFLCRYYNVPRLTQVPLFRKVEPSSRRPPPTIAADRLWFNNNVLRDLRDKSRIVLSTSSIKKVTYKASDFELPKNYHRIGDAGDIGINGAQRSQLGAALDELGFSSDYVRNEKREK
jgi:hypothetical protein